MISQAELDKLSNSIKKPTIRKTESSIASPEEIAARQKAIQQLAALGIQTSQFDTEINEEDPDILQAILLTLQGNPIPEELKQKILVKQASKSESSAPSSNV